mmetsp:Transcript_18854/g.47372  ORF Transcript_18854/g.47372 Transcript_18854/m.47372 type:complete len:281 (+) Transcript_18854:656-1498(+)
MATWVCSTSLWCRPTSGTGMAAEARMEGSRPPSSTCVLAASTRSNPCSALSARVWSRPKRKDASSAGSRGVNSTLSVLVKGGLASAVAGAAAAAGEGGVVTSRLGRKAPKLRTSCGLRAKLSGGSESSSIASSCSRLTVSSRSSLSCESSSSTASLSSAPSQRTSTPCSRLVWPCAASTSAETLQPTKREGRLPPSTEKAPRAWKAAGSMPASVSRLAVGSSSSSATTSGTRPSARVSVAWSGAAHPSHPIRQRRSATVSLAMAEPTCALRQKEPEEKSV